MNPASGLQGHKAGKFFFFNPGCFGVFFFLKWLLCQWKSFFFPPLHSNVPLWKPEGSDSTGSISKLLFMTEKTNRSWIVFVTRLYIRQIWNSHQRVEHNLIPQLCNIWPHLWAKSSDSRWAWEEQSKLPKYNLEKFNTTSDQILSFSENKVDLIIWSSTDIHSVPWLCCR